MVLYFLVVNIKWGWGDYYIIYSVREIKKELFRESILFLVQRLESDFFFG